MRYKVENTDLTYIANYDSYRRQTKIDIYNQENLIETKFEDGKWNELDLKNFAEVNKLSFEKVKNYGRLVR